MDDLYAVMDVSHQRIGALVVSQVRVPAGQTDRTAGQQSHMHAMPAVAYYVFTLHA